MISLRSLKSKYVRHSFTVSLLDVQNNFIRNAVRSFLFFCVCLGVLFVIFNVAIECISMNKVDYKTHHNIV